MEASPSSSVKPMKILCSLLSTSLLLAACAQPVTAPPQPAASPSPATLPAATASPTSAGPPLVLPSSTPSATPPLILPSAEPAAKGPTALQLDKTDYAPGETITVSFSVDPQSVSDPHAWVGLLPADVPHGSALENDKFDLAYQYLDGKTTGTMTFQAPEDPGSYDLRLHDAEGQGRELASAAFKVVGTPKPLIGNAIRLNKSRFAPGETINITVSINAADKADETAWVGIVPSAVEHGGEPLNDQFNLGYRFLGKLLYGQTTLPAPGAPGYYDLRLNSTDTDGVELAFVTFVVE